MPYVVQSSERVRGIGAEYETKAMLYLMNCRDDSFQISCFAIDFYNDVTGLNIHADKAWDVQSKGKRTGGPKDIGRELVTLFKNYMSDLQFDYLILFMATCPATLRSDQSLSVFGISNVLASAKQSLRNGLIEEAKAKTYIDDSWVTDDNIDAFLQEVTFVVDDKSKAEYIKEIISVNPKYIPQDSVLDGIFNQIRDAQAGKKNNESVEGEVVSRLRDVFAYDRIIKANEIRLMVLNVFINRDVMHTDPPQTFYQLLHRFDGIKIKDIIEDCKLQISRLLYDKTYTDEFWELLDLLCRTIEGNRTITVKEVYDLISNEKSVNNPRLDYYTVLYLISVMKEALQ